jgi:hypothetical protein
MRTNLFIIAGIALAPAVALGQDQGAKPKPTVQPTPTTSAGDVSMAANVPQSAIQAQNDPKLIGSPAWWKTHVTADGKPKNG